MQYNFKGKYDQTKTYQIKDVVSYQPTANDPIKYYFCLVSNNGQVPNIGGDSQYWGILNSLSNYPNTVDTFMYHSNILASDKKDITRFQTLTLQQTLTPSEQDELTNLTIKLRNKLILPDDLNSLQDSITNMQFFLNDSIDGYINQKQDDFNSELNKFTFINEYNPTTQYYKRNTITYNGESYLCLMDSKGNAPDPNNNTTYWSKIASRGSKGDKGDNGVGLSYKGGWNPSTNYLINEAVTFNGQLYACMQGNIGNQPSLSGDTAYWSMAVAKGASTTVTMLKNSVVINNQTNNVPIGISAFNSSNDALLVIKNTATLAEGINYKINANGTSIDSLEGLWDGTTYPITIHFIVLKNMVNDVSFSDGSLIQDNTINKNKLTQGLQDEINNKALNADLTNHIEDTTIHKTSEEIRTESSTELRVEVRTSDPTSPAVGRIWLRSDL